MPLSDSTPFAQLFHHNPAGLVVTRRSDSIIIEVNEAYCDITGFARDEIIGNTALALGIWLEPAERATFVDEILRAGRLRDHRMQIRSKSGELRYLDVFAELAQFDGVECLLTMIIDRTERAQIRQQLEAAVADATRFREALDNVPAYVYIKDTNHRYAYANKLTLALFDRTAETIKGAEDSEFFPPEAVAKLHEIDRRVFSGENTAEEIRITDAVKGSRVFWEVKSPIHDLEKISGLVGISTDITEHKDLERKLEEQAQTDFLTRLPNRSHFFEMAHKEFARSKRYREPLSIAMLDLDHFKNINDTYGHEIGDFVLKELGQICLATLRDSDVVGRIGGEEFAVLWPNADLKHAAEAAERLRAAIDMAKLPLERGLPIQFTASLGVATLDEADVNVDMFLSRADKALYEAKRTGRNKICFAS